MSNTQLLVVFKNSVSKVKECLANKDAVGARKHLVEANKNYMSDLNQDVIFELAQAVYMLEFELSQVANIEVEEVVVESTPVVEVVKTVEKSKAEKIMDALYAKGYMTRIDSEECFTVMSDDYDVSVTVLENGFELETYCNNVGIEHFRSHDWANHKVVKTLKGLNGYFRKFGVAEVSI